METNIASLDASPAVERGWPSSAELSAREREATRSARERVFQARPWQLPLRPGRLTAAAFSALFVLLITAEVWGLGTSQTGGEQEVVTNVSAILVVRLGLITTYGLLFALTVGVGHTIFSAEIVARWAPGLESEAGGRPLLAMAGMAASLGLLIGSLGASLEGQSYFRHVIYADEET